MTTISHKGSNIHNSVLQAYNICYNSKTQLLSSLVSLSKKEKNKTLTVALHDAMCEIEWGPPHEDILSESLSDEMLV